MRSTSTRWGEGWVEANRAMCALLHFSSTYGGTTSPFATRMATSSVVNSRSIDCIRTEGERLARYPISAAPRIWMRKGWMKFMWPTWPIVGFIAESPVSTLLPPWRPASQVRPRRDWLSSKSFWTLTCRSMKLSPLIALASSGMPVLEQRVQARRAVGATQLVTELAVGEHLRKLGQQLQVLLGGVLGHEQHEHLRDGLAVGRVECNGRGEARECSLRGGEAPDATVRNGDALAEARRAELLA